MPINHEIYLEHNVVVVRWNGQISNDDLIPAYDLVYTDSRWQPELDEINDIRHAALAGVTSDGLRNLAIHIATEIIPQHSDITHKTAVVAPGDLQFGLSRMYEMLSENSDSMLKVFRKFSDAVTWLEIDASFHDARK